MSALSTFEQVELQEKLAQSSKEIERLNALVAMQAETLKDISGCENDENHIAAISFAQDALSASSETAAKWEAEKLLPLQRQVAMLINTLMAVEVVGMHYEESSNIYFTCPECEFNRAHTSQGVRHAKDCMIQNAISNTQATSEAYLIEHDAKVLEAAAKWFYEETEYAPADGKTFERPELILGRMAAELRAANKKENE